MRDDDRAAEPAHVLAAVVLEQAHQPLPDRAEPQQTDADGLGHGPFFNSFLMPRIAWRVRCSFSISAKRTWSSPYSPKPAPGDTATLASSSRRLENSIEPIARNGSGIRAQTNIVALGRVTG